MLDRLAVILPGYGGKMGVRGAGIQR